MPSTPHDEFVETTELPRGRKAREVSETVLAKLHESAKRGIAFTRSATPDVIEELRKDLGSAAVRAKYVVTVATDKTNDALHKLTFSAKTKPAEPAANADPTK